MMINALNHIEKINHELITFSDDMDGLRKVPDNIPNDQVLKDNLGKPLTIFQIHLKNLIVLVSIIMRCLKNF
jgi:lysyl-tRNA synthetase class I